MNELKSTGDMPHEEFRKYGHQLVDWIADFFSNIDDLPVLSETKPGDVKAKLSEEPPEKGESMESILADIDPVIMPGMTHWNHPNFMAYFNSTSSGPGILAELLTASFNINGMNWKSCPAATELEQVTLGWLRQMLGMPEKFWGIIYDTASVSTMHALACARENVNLSFREKGMAGRVDLPKLRLYISEHTHSSIAKGALTLGIGLEGIRKIEVDENFSMISESLEEAVDEDIKNGWHPFCVVATVGTTSTTSIDPVEKIAGICEKNNIWLHVDAAHAGIAAIVPEMKFIMKGVERADSLVLNPHKWMFTPIDLSVLFTSKPEILKQAFSLVAEYLKTEEDTKVENFMDYGIQLGRRFRSLKLWFIIRYFGREGIISRVREHLRIGRQFAMWIDEHPLFERTAPTPFSTTCFRAIPGGMNDEDELNNFNERLMNAVNETGKVFLSHTKLKGKFVIRLVVSGIRTEEKHVKDVWQLLQNKLEELS